MKDYELKLKLAKIYKVLGPKDDRLQVLFFDMLELPEKDLDNLPKYPPFFKGQVITGKSINKDGRSEADLVWVLVNNDYSFGYIFSRVNSFESITGLSYAESYDYYGLKEGLEKINIWPEDTKYEDLIIQASYKLDGIGMLELINIKRGDKIIVLSSGTVVSIQQDSIVLRVGSPSKEEKESEYSLIKMTPVEISFKAPSISFDTPNLSLGKHGGYLVSSPGTTSTSAEGVPLNPIKSISV